MGNYALRRVQVGAESTKGTAVTAGVILTGLDGQIKDESGLEMRQLDYVTGLFTGSAGTDPVFVSDTGTLKLDGDLTYQNAAYILALGWSGVAPVSAGAGSAIWTFNPPTTSANSPKTLTIQTGDNTQQLKGTYAIAPDFEIKGTANELLKATVNVALRSISAASSGFDSATALSATPIPFNTTKVFLDASTGSFGTTALSATVKEYTVKAKSGFHHKQFADGVLYPTSDGQARPEVTLSMTLEYNASAVSIHNDWKNKTPRLIQILAGSSATANPSLQTNIAGYFTQVNEISEDEGNTTAVVEFQASPVSTATSGYCQFVLRNALTTGL